MKTYEVAYWLDDVDGRLVAASGSDAAPASVPSFPQAGGRSHTGVVPAEEPPADPGHRT